MDITIKLADITSIVSISIASASVLAEKDLLSHDLGSLLEGPPLTPLGLGRRKRW